jgi:tetratricopeptide (TPR) repeat protein
VPAGVEPPVTGPEAAEFLVALGHFARTRKLLVSGAKPDAAPATSTAATAAATAAAAKRRDELAAALFRRARGLGDAGYESAHHLGDALFRLERYAEALPLFQQAAQFAEAEVWTYVNGAAAAAKVGAFRAGRELLEAGKRGVSGDPVWREAVQTLAEAYFNARTARARRLYAFGDEGRARADAQIARVIASTSALWTGLDPVGAPTPATADRRVVVLASFDIQVCNHYRIDQKEELFELLDRPVEFYRLDQWREFISALHGASAAFFFRLPAWPSVVRAMTTARRMGVPTYYEIDDLIFDAKEYPDTLESYGGLLSREAYESLLFGVPLFRAAVELCDYGISSTTPLARAVEPLVRTGQVFWLPNGWTAATSPICARRPPGFGETAASWSPMRAAPRRTTPTSTNWRGRPWWSC